jgi:hypothetical protein
MRQPERIDAQFAERLEATVASSGTSTKVATSVRNSAL